MMNTSQKGDKAQLCEPNPPASNPRLRLLKARLENAMCGCEVQALSLS